MIELKKIAVIGGDLRQIKMATFLKSDEYDVSLFGFDKWNVCDSMKICQNLEEALENADITILGLPCSIDDETINASLSSEKIYLKELLKLINKNTLLVGGRISEKVHNMIKIHGVYAVDYFEREELQVLNAIPSAEGAIQIAMEETIHTINGSKCLVLGFGRIGKVLSKMLWGLGADVTCTARKFYDLAWIKNYGYKALQTDKIINHLGQFNIVFNTIPSRILGTNELKMIPNDSIIIDLASKPGGVDIEAAKNLGIKVIWALSLPGKVSPILKTQGLKSA